MLIVNVLKSLLNMPIAKISQNAEIDPASAYFEDYKNGSTIVDICRKYGKSRNTVLKYLRQNEDFVPPGGGYKVTGDARKVGNIKHEEVRLVAFNCPVELINKLDQVPGKNRTVRIHRAVENYLQVPKSDRYRSKYSTKDPYVPIRFKLELRLLKKLDRSNGERTGKLIAAIEQYCIEAISS